ncbi:MAG: 4Fe-4S dicluster domain-containing protein [Planctomycetes bacterium]|nr:4Fe-4S dicluster domain-containing protein [Planctomycetota bacterium]
MGHMSVRSGYQQLVERLNRCPQGAPPSALLYEILKLLFSEREAGLVAALPIQPFTAESAAAAWKLPVAEARRVLDGLASRAILLDVEQSGRPVYVLPPPMAGFFEFSLMRVRGDLDQKTLSELFFQYLNVEEDFIKALFTEGQTQLGRVFVNESVVSGELSLHVLDYERASEVVRTATHRAVGLCYCRHKMQHLGRACDAPLNVCMTFGDVGACLARHGYAREVDTSECLDLLQQARARHLVQFGENVRTGVKFICNCCGCCCEAMQAARRFGHLHPVHTTNVLPRVAAAACSGCAKCVQRCPVGAVALVSAGDAHAPRRMVAHVDESACLGCGVCAAVCTAKHAVTLVPRPQRVLTPVNSTHKMVLMAIERGKLQDLIFDNRALWSHRAMAAILGVILKLPPIRQVMASVQMKSNYLDRLLGG